MHLPLDPVAAHRAVSGRDARWDGRLYLGVVTTGIYCRPSCPARTPRPENCQYFPAAAAAVAAGFRACKRCRPDALPGSRHWDARGDLVSRAVRLIADGAVDEAGVAGLARSLAVSERHLHRMLVAEVGATPQQLARTRRAHAARLLIEQTALPLTDVAFAAGFGSLRQFNDVMRQEFGMPPRSFRRAAAIRDGAATRTAPPEAEGRSGLGPATIALRLTFRGPLALEPLRRTLRAHALERVEHHSDTGEAMRTLAAPSGPAVARIHLGGVDDGAAHPALRASFTLTSLSDLMPAVGTVRRWLDLDADPALIGAHLGEDEVLAPLVAAHPGLRVPGAVDGAELAICAVLGQQVSLAVARTFQSRIAAAFGAPVPASFTEATTGMPDGEAVTFPTPSRLAEVGAQAIRDAANLTQARARAVHTLASVLAEGVRLDTGLRLAPGVDPEATRASLLALPGIGPWTADYIALRALRDPDAFMPSDLVLRKALAAAQGVSLKEMTPRRAEAASQPWRPWRSYALQHLWTATAYA
ncbi:DNA-3-methyladenine glycosylase 2 family protein [Serinibacter salmoneus]|uniref:DNA-3-methyladenine glycosylase II n=1 Tax=Serinibacter salmoneus TaxID=556530 RepID=A0A2A9CW99_9MICO|nr:Ada metal-binding domain-containing protein [Serinibacter salmoneus]PFG18708.1 DNA-3-methyladenine glycosylase II [Serinibacter salmoneus]